MRLVQPIGNVDFDVSLKLDSAAVAKDADTSQGLMVLADDRNFVTLSVSTNGTSITLSGQAVQQGAATTWFENTEFAEYQNPLYLRLPPQRHYLYRVLLRRRRSVDGGGQLRQWAGSYVDRAVCR